MNLSELKSDYLLYSKHFKSPGSYRYDQSHLTTIIDYFMDSGYEDSDELTFESFYDFIDYSRISDNTNKTINKRIALLNRALTFQVKQGKAKPSITASFPKLKEIDKRYEIVNEHDMIQIIGYLMKLDDSFLNLRNKIIFFLFIDTGMRLSELAHVKIKNVDFSTDSILLTETKTKRERVVYFSDTTSEYLRRYLTMIDESSDYLLRSFQYPDQPITYTQLLFKKGVNRGLRRFSFIKIKMIPKLFTVLTF